MAQCLPPSPTLHRTITAAIMCIATACACDVCPAEDKKGTLVVLSTKEAEFTNLTRAGLSTKWVSKVAEECGAPQPTPIILFTDGHNAYPTATNPLNKARTHCSGIRYKWVRGNWT